MSFKINKIASFRFRALGVVPDTTLAYFREFAQEVLNDGRSAVDALAAAIAIISGNSEVKQRSLLSSREVGKLTFNLFVT